MTTTCTRHEWTAPDGATFSYSLWNSSPAGGEKPRAVIVAIHGLSGAALDYEPLGAHMVQHGVTTFAPELRGQGNDPLLQRRGDLEKVEDWFADLSAFFAMVRQLHPGAPVYYYGESMGAALLTRFVAQALPIEQPAGLVLASPVVEIKAQPTWWQEQVFRFFLWIGPTHRIDVRKYTKRHDENDRAHWVTRDEAHRRWFEGSSHRITAFTVRFFRCLRELIGGCFDAAPKVSVPVLVAYAANDVFIAPARVEAFFERIGSRDKTIRFFPESHHLLLHDFDKAQALQEIETWLLQRVGSNDEVPGTKSDPGQN